jgi:excisionase family DNA binding protein
MEVQQSFSTSEVATFCHVTADTVRKWAEAGRVKVFKTPGGHRRIRLEDLVQFLTDNNIPIPADLGSNAIRILVVDDEKSVISLMRRFLERSKTPFKIEVATDGYEAGHEVAVFRPDVVFLDLRLPGVDGFEVCRRIKSAPKSAHTHVIAMTGYYEGESANRVIECGATMCLHKPFLPADIQRALAKVGITIEWDSPDQR